MTDINATNIQASSLAQQGDQKQQGKDQDQLDCIDFILLDHSEVRACYQFLKENKDNVDSKEMGDLIQTKFEGLLWNIAKHSVAEEMVLYPLYDEYLGDEGKELRENAVAEHNDVKMFLEQLDGRMYKEKEVQELVDEMMEAVVLHMNNEESGDLVKIRELVPKQILLDVGVNFEQTKILIPEEETPGSMPREATFLSAAKLASADMENVKESLKKLMMALSDRQQQPEEVHHYNLRHRDQRGRTTPELDRKASAAGEQDDLRSKKSRSPARKKSQDRDQHGKSGEENPLPPAKRSSEAEGKDVGGRKKVAHTSG